MEKSEMSPEQLAARSLIVDRLQGAGWIARSNENQMFDEGFWVMREVALAYRRAGVDQTIFFRGDQNRIYHGFQLDSGRGLELAMAADEHLPRILDVIVAWQDRLDDANYREPIRELMQAGVEVFASTDGDRFVRLKDERK